MRLLIKESKSVLSLLPGTIFRDFVHFYKILIYFRDTYVLDVKQSDHSIKQSPQDVPLSALALSDNLPTQSNMKVAVQVEEKSSVVNVPFKFTYLFIFLASSIKGLSIPYFLLLTCY